jgi:hypothetical protein
MTWLVPCHRQHEPEVVWEATHDYPTKVDLHVHCVTARAFRSLNRKLDALASFCARLTQETRPEPRSGILPAGSVVRLNRKGRNRHFHSAQIIAILQSALKFSFPI